MTPIDVAWLNEDKKVLVSHFKEDWNWVSLDHAGNRAAAMMDSIDYPIVHVLDLTDVNKMPSDIMEQGRKGLQRAPHPRQLMVIVVGMNHYVYMLYNTVKQIFPSAWVARWNIAFARTIDEALILAESALESYEV